MPANPLVDEEALLELLHDTITPKTPDQIRWTANMVLLAANGRQATSEFFVEVINTAAEIHTLLGELSTGAKMQAVMRKLDPDRDNLELDKQTTRLLAELNDARKTLTAHMELVIQCPMLSDAIN